MDVRAAAPSIRTFPGKAEFLAARSNLGTFGGSDVATILGYNPYKTPWEWWAERRGILPAFGGNERTRGGERAEPAILGWYADEVLGTREREGPTWHLLDGVAYMRRGSPPVPWVFSPSIFLHPTDHLAHCSPDGVVASWLDNAWVLRGGVDAKNTDAGNEWQYGADGSDVMPDAYWFQLQWCCYVTGAPWWDLAVCFGGYRYRWFRVIADAQIQAEVASRIREFHVKHVAGGVEPPATPAALARSRAAIKARHPRDTGSMLTLTSTTREMVWRLGMIRALAKKADAMGAAYESALLRILMDGTGFEDGAGSPVVTWKRSKDGAPTTDWKAVAVHLAETLAANVAGQPPADEILADACVGREKPGRQGSRRIAFAAAAKALDNPEALAALAPDDEKAELTRALAGAAEDPTQPTIPAVLDDRILQEFDHGDDDPEG